MDDSKKNASSWSTLASILIPEDILRDDQARIDHIAKKLTIGARRAMLQLDFDWRESKEGRFSHNGAQFLHWHYQDLNLAEKHVQRRKPTVAREFAYYRLTPLGMRVKSSLVRQGIT